jgi:hypothetical protein
MAARNPTTPTVILRPLGLQSIDTLPTASKLTALAAQAYLRRVFVGLRLIER